MAQAQGIHIDGERWRLPRKETGTRRRLWSHLYMLDKTIALAIGRPFAIVDQQCLVKRATHVWLDDETDESAATASELPLCSACVVHLLTTLQRFLATFKRSVSACSVFPMTLSSRLIVRSCNGRSSFLHTSVSRIQIRPWIICTLFCTGIDCTYTQCTTLHVSPYTDHTCCARASRTGLKQVMMLAYLQLARTSRCK